MKFSTSQRTLYLLSAVLLALTLAIVAAWGLWRAPGTQVDGAGAPSTPNVGVPQEGTGLAVPETASDAVKTVVYYQDNYGYLVPVTRSIPNEPGIAKATLAMMVKSAYNDMEAARLGLRTVLPEGTSIDLDVSKDGVARIDLGTQVMKMADAQAEAAMVDAVVQTLTEFPTVERVEFLVGGQKRDALTFGTKVSGVFERGSINLEGGSQSAVEPSAMQTVQLYFPGDASSLLVPVTRMVYGPSDINTAVLELLKGPSAQSPLDNTLPPGCGLIGVAVKNGVATINFTKEFMNVAENSDGGRVALRALVLTCTRFDGIKRVDVQVEG
ncbi:MAG: GerMN domain-containing protein, partial [Christensenellaceae bacterium]|nr:GerMN domain-containing protein [Christensenellaceae bacterium]